VVIGLAVDARARAFKALSPGMLSPLGIIFGLLVGFVAVQVWNDFDRAKMAVMTEASALRGIVLLTDSVPEEQRGALRRLVNRHIEEAVTQEWGSMAKRRDRCVLRDALSARTAMLRSSFPLSPWGEHASAFSRSR
jgi:uncharacterized protein YbaA (DUF1428 family)